MPKQTDDDRPVASAVKILDLLGGSDSGLGKYLAEGSEIARSDAEDSALEDALALTHALTCMDERNVLDKAEPTHWSRVAWIAATKVERALQLRTERKEGSGHE